MVPLAQARGLTAAERALLEALVDRTGSAALRAQARQATVNEICSCGCPSVGLHCDGPTLSTEDMLGFSGLGRDDWFAVRAYHDGVDVVVHVVEGTIEELEVYAGDGVVPALPSPEDLTDVEIY